MDTLLVSWDRFWIAAGARQPAPGLLAELLLAWTEPHRHYHTLQHLAECLSLLEAHAHQAKNPAAIGLALFFHDAIYDPRAQDNEARSADWARQALGAAGFEERFIEQVADMILATRHATQEAESDTALLLDIDLAILGANPHRFAEYEAQVRAEYAWVAEPAFRTGRAQLLRSFLARPHLYRTAAFAELESRARGNLDTALRTLENTSDTAEHEAA
ncbi:N-methyl-D-aspartate receptor NMDAR2C subunit [Uliginosibacterium sp. TH139]|uniref:HD domain-containing protein n=1 Tax=Uliginosibacterium sp. TH139 TaxID=2067453 RepID=UPI000C7BA12A|nr:N-methyl-D-aspartate receptor NMDAR2C subunit [Uliginosibacterium sp. TH139]PLK47119.1 N-methyl-D-aspartate receptor NMDAR2C subunit [Uliginosibacterium sp. TH139]